MNSYSDAAATVTKHGVEKNTKYDESIKTTISVATADMSMICRKYIIDKESGSKIG